MPSYLSKEQRAALENGVEIDGKMTLPSEVRVVSREEGRVVIELTIFEGRNRQIRKMCESLGLEVARLKRIKIGSVKLGMLKTGDYRHLTPDEVHALMTSAERRAGKSVSTPKQGISRCTNRSGTPREFSRRR